MYLNEDKISIKTRNLFENLTYFFFPFKHGPFQSQHQLHFPPPTRIYWEYRLWPVGRDFFVRVLLKKKRTLFSEPTSKKITKKWS